MQIIADYKKKVLRSTLVDTHQIKFEIKKNNINRVFIC